MQNKKIVFLASDCESSRWVYNAIKKKFNITALIIEQPISKKILFKARSKRIGLFKVASQAIFSILFVPFLRKKAINRKHELVAQYQLDNTNFSGDTIHRVKSVNNDACKQLLENIQPDIVLVNGTRIISKKILQCSNASFINMHAGITPLYRGSHGGYWALHNNDADNFGTTIHFVDTGVDTGKILKQVFAKPTKADNFTTYPVIQSGIGIQALPNVLKAVMDNNYESTSNIQKGRLYFQPTVWEYMKNSTK